MKSLDERSTDVLTFVLFSFRITLIPLQILQHILNAERCRSTASAIGKTAEHLKTFAHVEVVCGYRVWLNNSSLPMKYSAL